MRLNDKKYGKVDFRIRNIDWILYIVDDKNYKLYDENVDQKTVSKDDAAMGMCYKQAAEIYISKDMSDANFRRTLIHELTHAVLFTYGITFMKAEFDEEDICISMETHAEEIIDLTDGIVDIIKKNSENLISSK